MKYYKTSLLSFQLVNFEWMTNFKTERLYCPQIVVEIEIEKLSQIKIALKSKPDILLLDNLNLSEIKKAIFTIRIFKYCKVEKLVLMAIHEI